MIARYRRQRPMDRPLCPVCKRPFLAGSTRGRITYYYRHCGCFGKASAKVPRTIATPAATEAQGTNP